MSRIAGVMLTLAAAPAQGAAPPMKELTAEQVLAAHWTRTSIGTDSCRDAADDTEIVVCKRRGNPYAVPLYEPQVYDRDRVAGGVHTAGVREAQRAFRHAMPGVRLAWKAGSTCSPWVLSSSKASRR